MVRNSVAARNSDWYSRVDFRSVGDVGVKGVVSNIDIGFEELFKHLTHVPLALSADIRYHRWELFANGEYIEVGDSAKLPCLLFTNVNAHIKAGGAGAFLGYRLINCDKAALSLFAGARYTYLDGVLSILVNGNARLHLNNLLALEKFRWEGPQALTPGKHTMVFDFKCHGPGMGKGGTGVLSMDGKEVASKRIPHTVPALFTFDESFDVEVDTPTGISNMTGPVWAKVAQEFSEWTTRKSPAGRSLIPFRPLHFRRSIRQTIVDTPTGVKDYTITAEVTIPKGGAEGMIATMGGRFGGYGLYLLKGKPVFTYNLLDLERYRWEGGVGARDWLGRALEPGKHTIVFDFKYDGPGPGKGGTGVMTVDGKEFARKEKAKAEAIARVNN